MDVTPTEIFAAEMSAVDPGWGWQAVLFIFAAVFLVEKGLNIARNGKSQRRDVSIVEGGATHADVQAVRKDYTERINAVAHRVSGVENKVEEGFSKIAEALQESETRILDKGEERAVTIHTRMNEFGDRLGEIRGEMNAWLRGRMDK